jgi:hypothetical protein
VDDWKVRHPNIPPMGKERPEADSTVMKEMADSMQIKEPPDTTSSGGHH